MKKLHFFILGIMALSASCATLNESIQLGGAMGAGVGAASTFVSHSASNTNAKLGDYALGAGIGLTLGVITSYFTHKSVETKRASLKTDHTELHFGDLPPSPFIFNQNKR